MNGFQAQPAYGLGVAPLLASLAFKTNGTSDPSMTTATGSMKRILTSITYSATGILTIIFDAGWNFPETPTWLVTARCADQSTNAFIPVVKSWTNSTRTLVLQLIKPNNTDFQAVAPPAADDNNWINLLMLAVNSGGA